MNHAGGELAVKIIAVGESILAEAVDGVVEEFAVVKISQF